MPQIVAIVSYQLSPFGALLTHREHYWQTEFILFKFFSLKASKIKFSFLVTWLVEPPPLL